MPGVSAVPFVSGVVISKLESTRRKISTEVSIPARTPVSRATIFARAWVSAAMKLCDVMSPVPMSSANARSIRSGGLGEDIRKAEEFTLPIHEKVGAGIVRGGFERGFGRDDGRIEF